MAKTQDFEFRYAACRGRHSLQTDYGLDYLHPRWKN